VATTLRTPPREVVGLAAVILVFIAISALFALGRPYFAGTDESSHLGYAHVVADLRLPTIDGEPDVPESATTWQIERASVHDDRYRAVWVANHPPLFYATLAPAIWVSELTDPADGGLMLLRFANIACAGAALVFVYLLGVRASGGIRRIGLTSAAIAGLIGLAPAVFSLGLNDGAGFLAGSAVLWAAVRCLQAPPTGPSTRDLVALGVSCVVAAGMRAATMIMATGVVIVLAAVIWWRGSGADRRRAVVGVACAGLVAPVLVFGWFYVRNIVLYGDVGASAYLLDRFKRVTRGSVFAMFTEGQIWLRLFRRTTTPSTLRNNVLPGLSLIVGATVAGLVIALRTGRTADTTPDRVPGRIDRTALALVTVGIAVIVVTVAQHFSGGGMAHSRYLFPALAGFAVLIAIGVDKIWPRVAPALLVAGMAWFSIASIPTPHDRWMERRQRAFTPPGFEVLSEVPGNTFARAVFAVLLVVGCVVGAAVLVAGVVDPYDRRRDAQAR
jgi:hypothetical protein